MNCPYFIENVLVPILLGFISFISFHFLAKPILDFFDLRKIIHESLIYYACVWPMSASQEKELKIKEMQSAIRGLAAKLTALDHSMPPYAHIVLNKICKRNIDMGEAVKKLFLYQNDPDNKHTACCQMDAQNAIEIALGLPRSHDDETLKNIREINNRKHVP